MPIEETLKTFLTANQIIAQAVGGRIYFGYAPPPGSTVPYLVIRRIKTGRDYNHDGPANPVAPVFRITCWTNSYKASVDLALLLIGVLHDENKNDTVDEFQFMQIVNEADSLEMTPEQLEKRYCGRFLDVEISYEE